MLKLRKFILYLTCFYQFQHSISLCRSMFSPGINVLLPKEFPLIFLLVQVCWKWGFWVAHLVKNPPAMQETLVQFLGWEGPLKKGGATNSSILELPLVGQMVKNPPAMQETWIWSLGWEDPLEEGMAFQSSTLAWRIPMDRGGWWATVHGAAKSWTRLSD